MTGLGCSAHIDLSGPWQLAFDTGAEGIRGHWVDRTTVVPAREVRREPIQDLHIYLGAPISSPVYEWLRTLGAGAPTIDMSAHCFGSQAMLEEFGRELRATRGQVFVSELGCGGMADLDAVVAGYQGREDLCDAREMRAFRDSLHEGFAARGLGQVFGSVRGLVEAAQAAHAAGLRRQVEAVLANPRVSGYCITQLNDVAWEFHAGLLDHWRRPKPAFDAVKQLNRPHCLILKAASPVTACGQSVPVTLTLSSREPLTGGERVDVTVTGPAGPAGQALHWAAPTGAGIRPLGQVTVETGAPEGEWRLAARLLRGEDTLAEAVETILVLEAVDLGDTIAAVECLGDAPAAFAGADRARGGAHVMLAARPASLCERDWAQLLDAVAAGRTAIVGPLQPRDAVALRALQERGLDIRPDLGIGNWMGCYHWLRDPELLADLPPVSLAGEPYVDVLPQYVLNELGGRLLAGSLRNTQTRREPARILWYSDVEAVSLGRGTLVFCQYRLFEEAGSNPLAGRLACNLLRLARGCQQGAGEGDAR